MEVRARDRLEAMSVVFAVVEAGSLSAAARQLNTPLATVSRKVSELEQHLRTRLFDRSSRKLVLTEAGSAYVAACKRILADLTEVEGAASGRYAAPAGELIITAPAGVGRLHLIPVLREFLCRPPIEKSRFLPDRDVTRWWRTGPGATRHVSPLLGTGGGVKGRSRRLPVREAQPLRPSPVPSMMKQAVRLSRGVRQSRP